MGPPALDIPGLELLEELGRGAHAVVYRARRNGRQFAAKVPLPGDGNPQSMAAGRRFLREAVSLARVRHPALPAVMEVGDARTPYIIMEFMAGETLAERLRAGVLEESHTLELGVQLAEALSWIHENGLVHRDIKATNILFDAHTTAARLVDFGLAADASLNVTSREGSEPPSRGSAAQADLFALGCVLFQCVTGQVPFAAVDPAPLLERAGDPSLHPRISRPLGQILRRLMGLGREPGFADARALLGDLRKLRTAKEGAEPGGGHARLQRSRSRTGVPLLGRERELDRLRAAWRASAGGRGQVVLIRGSAGSGKTRLTQAFLDELATHDQPSIVVRCDPAQHQPFALARRLLETHLDRYDGLPPARRLQALASFRALAGEVAPLLSVLSPRLAALFPDATPMSRSDGVEQIFVESLAEFLSKLLNDATPTAVVVDDVQWLDPGSRGVLGRLTDRASARVLYLLAARDDPAERAKIDRLVRTFEPERLWELRIDPLNEEHTAELVRAYLAQGSVDLDLLHYVAGLSDGTPLSILEILRSMLDEGALVPYWGAWKFNREIAARLGLPRGSVDLLGRRIADLDPACIQLLSIAAVTGAAFDINFLARTARLQAEQVGGILGEARRAMLIESDNGHAHRFMHDSVREALVQRLKKEDLASLHDQVAGELARDLGQALPGGQPLATREDAGQALRELEAALTPPDVASQSAHADLIFAVATHRIDAAPLGDANQLLESAVTAGKLAFRTYDNELALRFFDAASEAAQRLGTALELEVQLLRAEAQVRRGALEPGLGQLRAVLEQTDDSITRAFILSRVAWAEMQLDTERAWQALSNGFLALGERPPANSPIAVLGSVGSWLSHVLLPHSRPRDSRERWRLEVLSTLYYQAARLAADTGHSSWLLQAALRGLRPAERLGPSSALSRSYLIYSFVLSMLGFRKAGRRHLEMAAEAGRATHNPIVVAHVLQVHSVIAAWLGKIDESLSIGARSLDEYGHWRELGEYCLTAYNQHQVESVRGRSLEAWKWLERAIQKVSKHEGPPMALEFLEQSVRAGLTALGREQECETLLLRLANMTTRPPARGTMMVSCYGARVGAFTECGNLNADFDALVAEVEAAHYNPRRVHLEVVEYYVHVAHARVHACLRGSAETRAQQLAQLESALDDLKKAARIPLLRAHAIVVEGYLHWLCSREQRALRCFAEAEALAQREGVPWVLYAVLRGRAHLLRAAALPEAARDQARLAEAIAREHGSAYRVRWIREEFALGGRLPRSSSEASPGSPSGYSPSGSEPSRATSGRRAYLKSLVRVGQQTAEELDPRRQARLVLDELVDALRADRGLLFLARDWLGGESDRPSLESLPAGSLGGTFDPHDLPEDLLLVAARGAAGQELPTGKDYDARLIEDLAQFETPWAGQDTPSAAAGTLASYGDRAVAATALSVRGARVGVVYLDRPLRAGAFTPNDARVLSALADQVPLVFELGRTLRVREQVKETQTSAEKLEAVGRLAGGIAHDFNNMLAVILGACSHIETGAQAPPVDVKTIQSAAERARDLTRQLLAFSRGQYLTPEVLRLNDAVKRLEPIFRRLLGETITLELELEPRLCLVKADPAQIDQVLTNLVVNAGDAMPNGGRLRIESRSMVVSPGEAHGALTPGRYARILVSDTGQGMDDATRSRAFEPFFTTKQPHPGGGLGLATTYGIIKQSGGHIELESKLGSGTTFRIFLPESTGIPVPASVPPRASEPVPRGTETVLVVDDEPLVRDSTRRMLRALGYKVLAAGNSDEALAIARERIDSIDLVITDVIMPGMNGLELARELSRLRPSIKVLFVSGFTDGVLAERGVLRETVEFLQKPVTRERLAQQVRALLDPEKGRLRPAE